MSLPSATETVDVDLADFDLDGHLDLLATNDGDALGQLTFGDGTGQFSGSHLVPEHGLVVDLDADGKPDLVRTEDGIQVFLNRWDGRPE